MQASCRAASGCCRPNSPRACAISGQSEISGAAHSHAPRAARRAGHCWGGPRKWGCTCLRRQVRRDRRQPCRPMFDLERSTARPLTRLARGRFWENELGKVRRRCRRKAAIREPPTFGHQGCRRRQPRHHRSSVQHRPVGERKGDVLVVVEDSNSEAVLPGRHCLSPEGCHPLATRSTGRLPNGRPCPVGRHVRSPGMGNGSPWPLPDRSRRGPG